MKIIQNLLLLFCFFTFFNNLQAQEDKASKKRKVHQVKELLFGIRAGFNSSTATGLAVETESSFLGFHAGAYAQKPIQKGQLLLEVGAFYSQKGYDKAILFGDAAAFTFQADTVGGSAPGTLTVNYLDIPIIIKDNQHERFSPFAGLEWNILLNSKYKYSYTKITEELAEDMTVVEIEELIEDTQSNLSDLKNVNMSAIIGLEYHVNHFFNLNIAYSYGLSTIDKGNNVKLKLNTIRLSGGFSF